MASLTFHTIHVLVFCAYLLISTSSQSLPHQPKKHAAFFISGNSVYDVGNNNYINTTTDYQAYFWPYGETFFGCPTGRISDGCLIPDFIAEYAKLPLLPPYLQPGNEEITYGADLASAAPDGLNEIHQGLAINLNTQLCYFMKAKKQLRQSPSEYAFWDSFHLTEKLYKQLADEMWTGSP